MKKRIFSLLLAFLMVINVAPLQTFAEEGNQTLGSACDEAESVVLDCVSDGDSCMISEIEEVLESSEVLETFEMPEILEIAEIAEATDTPELQEIEIPLCSGAPLCWGTENGLPMNDHQDNTCARKEFLKEYVTTHTAEDIATIWNDLTETEQTDMMAMVESYANGYANALKEMVNWQDTEIPSEPEEIVSINDEVNGQTIVASGYLGENAKLNATEGDPEKNAYLNQDLRNVFNVYAYNIDLTGEFRGSVTLSISNIPVAGSNEKIEVLHLLDSAEAITAAKEKGTAQAYAAPGLSATFHEEVAASGEADTIYYETLSASRDADGNVVFTTDSFSEFIIYTVDFHYKGINFSIPGGTGILLSELLERLEINKSAASATDVTFSNYELVSVTPENGDWRLTSLQPFTTTELLVLTFSDGEVYEITVTDDQRAATSAKFIIQTNNSYEFVADLTDDGRVYHNNYEHTDYIYVSRGLQFEVWRDTLWGLAGATSVDANLWWSWQEQSDYISAKVDGGTVPYREKKEDYFLGILIGTYYKAYGGINSNSIRKATVSVSQNAPLNSYGRLRVNNGNPRLPFTQLGHGENHCLDGGNPNFVYIRVAEQVPITYYFNYDGAGTGVYGTQTGYSTGTASTSMKLKRLAAPAAPDGYTFGGWNTKADGSGTTYTADSTFQPTSNTMYYAKWIPISYNISFNGNGATSGSMGNQSFTFDEVKALSANNFKREYTVTYNTNGGSVSTATATASATFNGWEDRGSIIYDGKTYSYNGSEDNRTKFDAPYYVQPFANPSKSKDVYDDAGCGNGHYNKYGLVHHFVNHGIEEYYTNGATSRKPAPGVGETPGLYPDKATVSHMSTTSGYTVPLYANWVLGRVTLPEPTRAGYKFEGWYSDSGLTTRVGGAGDFYTPTTATTLYAKWSIESYTITYNTDGGKLGTGGTTSYMVTDTITIPSASYAGYDFKGWIVTTVDTEGNWNKDAVIDAGTISAGKYGNVTLTAQWEKIEGKTGTLKLDHEGSGPAIVTVEGEGLNITLVLDKDTVITNLSTGTYTVTASGADSSTKVTVDNTSPIVASNEETTVKISVTGKNISWFTGFHRITNIYGG